MVEVGDAQAEQGHGRIRQRTICGVLMHSSLVVTEEGLPLGLSAIKFWTRKKFKGCNALKKRVNPTRISINQKESIRWLENLASSTHLLGQAQNCIHIADREGDIYELFCKAQALETYFLVRSCVNRQVQQAGQTIETVLQRVDHAGVHKLAIINDEGKAEQVSLSVQYTNIMLRPPIGKHKQYPQVPVNMVVVTEETPPLNKKPIVWKLLTNLEVSTFEHAVLMLKRYAMRWKIEMFHKILTSGFRAEESKLRTAERITNLIAIYCLLGWRVFWMTMIKRVQPNITADIVLSPVEQAVLNKMLLHKQSVLTVAECITCIARLGGYLNRNHDPPPGNMVIWRGLSRLTDIITGYQMAIQDVGN